MREQTCCFTGHRIIQQTDMSTILARTEQEVCSLISSGITHFLVGGAVGYDTVVAELLFRLREEYPQITVVLAYPFEGFTDNWTEAQKNAYAHMLPRYDHTICTALPNGRRSFLARDRYMVDHASFCIAYCRKKSGGTAYTVRYALSQGIPVINTAAYDISQL